MLPIVVHRIGHGRRIRGHLIGMRIRGGMAVVKTKARLHGKKPKVCASQEKHRVSLFRAREQATPEVVRLVEAARWTLY